MSEPVELEIIVPEGSFGEEDADTLSGLLRRLTRELHERGHDISGGVLGGEYGYGAEFENDVFEMWPFYWGECDCGFEERSDAWWKANPHAPDCFSIRYDAEEERLRATGVDLYSAEGERPMVAWAKANGYAEAPFGMAVHCDCGTKERRKVWGKAGGDCAARCSVERPNFVHKPSGLTVRWYRYIGRDMEVENPNRADPLRVILDCIDSLP